MDMAWTSHGSNNSGKQKTTQTQNKRIQNTWEKLRSRKSQSSEYIYIYEREIKDIVFSAKLDIKD